MSRDKPNLAAEQTSEFRSRSRRALEQTEAGRRRIESAELRLRPAEQETGMEPASQPGDGRMAEQEERMGQMHGTMDEIQADLQRAKKVIGQLARGKAPSV